MLPPIVFPNPVYSMAVRPTSKAGVDKLGPSLQRLLEEDPGLRLTRDAASSGDDPRRARRCAPRRDD